MRLDQRSKFALLGLLAVLMALLLTWRSLDGEGWIERTEWASYDWRARLALATGLKHGRSPDPDFAFVEVSDDTQAAVRDGQFGYQFGLYWPRQVYARALREMRLQGSQAVALDVMFYDERPDHPKVQSSEDPQPISSDQYFVRELSRHGRVILAADKAQPPAKIFRDAAGQPGDVSTSRDADGVLRHVRAFVDYRFWHPSVLQWARAVDTDLALAEVGLKQITFRKAGGGDPIVVPRAEDGSLVSDDIGEESERPIQPLVRHRVWQMGLVLAATRLGIDLGKAEVDLAGGHITLRGTNGLVRTVPVDSQGRFLINWTQPFERVPKWDLAQLLEDDFQRLSGNTPGLTNQPLKGRLVLVGSVSTGNDLSDVGATPVHRETFLVTKHWHIARAVLDDEFLRRLPPEGTLACVGAFSILCAVLTLGVEQLWIASMGMFLVGAAYAATAVWCLRVQHVWMPMVMPLGFGILLPHLGLAVARVKREQNERRRVRSVFSRIVAPEVVQELLAAEHVSLGGARREVTVFFADVRGFTEFTDQRQAVADREVQETGAIGLAAEAIQDRHASGALETVNEYLGCVAEIIKAHHGTLDKYIGDCVMAFWGAPVPNPHHVSAGVRAAIEAQQAIHRLNEARTQENRRREAENPQRVARGLEPVPLLPVLSLGTGVHTGKAIAGLMGSEQHILNYTVFGRDVNLASRLEGISGRGNILISETTWRRLMEEAPDLGQRCVERPPVSVKGLREPVKIFEVPWQEQPVP